VSALRISVDRAVEAALAGTVFLFACGSSSVDPVYRFGGTARWAALVVLAAAAAAFAWPARRPRALPRAWILAAVFLALCLLSVAWSVDPRLTLERTATLGLLFATVALLALGAHSRPSGIAPVFRGILVGAAAVALAGLVVLAVSRDDAVQHADAGSGWRFRGFGENPNTASMLYAVALPLVTWLLVAGSRRGRAVAAPLGLLLVGSIAVSGSRGALGAGFAGAFLVAAVLPRSRQARVALGAAVIVLLLVAGFVSKLPKPVPEFARAAAAAHAAQSRTRGIDLQNVIRLEDEIGRPPQGAYRPSQKRAFFSFGARGAGWGIGIHLGELRPVDGYGFGTEDRVFVDRSSIFEGGLPENSYVGAFMQLGLVGLALFVGVLAALAAAAWIGLRRLAPGLRPEPLGASAVLLVAVLLGIGQSSLYSVGNIATVSIWSCIFAIPLLVQRDRA
jgi:hypothetical protein